MVVRVGRYGPYVEEVVPPGVDPSTGEVTDEASAIESTGARPLLVPGGAQNIKVTYPDDFALAEAILRSRTP